MLRIGAIVCCSLLILAAWTVPTRGDAIPEAKARLLEDVKYLASDELEGRGVGTKGLTVAAEFIRDQFAKAGLASALIIDGSDLQDNFALAARNIPQIDVLPIEGINVYDILRREKLVLTKAALDALEARFK